MKLSHRKARLYCEMALNKGLPGERQVRLEEHLAECALCRAYAQELEQFDKVLVHSLAGLGAAPPASRQKLAETAALAQARYRRFRFWRPFRVSGRLALNGALVVILIVAALLFLRPPETAVDEIIQTPSPDLTPDLRDKVTALTSDYVVVHFDFGGSVDALELVHPACDGMAHLPKPDQMAQVAASGQRPHCELIASSTLLFKPGESRQVLTIYRNTRENEIELTFTPGAVTEENRPFLQAFCQREDVSAAKSCTQFTLKEGGVWARYVSLQAPQTAELGSSITVTFDVLARDLATKP